MQTWCNYCVCVFVCVCASSSLYCTAARLKMSDLCGVRCIYDRYFLHWLKDGSRIPPKLLDSREPTHPSYSRSQLPLCPLILARYRHSPPVNVCPVIEWTWNHGSWRTLDHPPPNPLKLNFHFLESSIIVRNIGWIQISVPALSTSVILYKFFNIEEP